MGVLGHGGYMNYGPNEEWDKHRKSSAPPERDDNHLERRVAIGLVVSLVVLGGALVKACSAEGDDNSSSSTEYVVDQLHPSRIIDTEADLKLAYSPTHIPLDFIVEYTPEAPVEIVCLAANGNLNE